MKNTRKQTIKMIAFNQITEKLEEVYPEDEVTTEEMIPMFWTNYDMRWVTVPGTTADEVYEKWLSQI